MTTTIPNPPASSITHAIRTLAHLHSYDAVLKEDYVFVACKETERAGSDWRIRIRCRHTPGAVFEPAVIAEEARAAWADGKPFFKWGQGIDPTVRDPRCIEFRVHVIDGKPSEIEIFVQLRRHNGTADRPRSIRFAWPV